MVGDVDRVAQILSNLVSNAQKYTPSGGHVWITAQADGSHVRFDVRDDGIGLTKDEQAKLFQKFYRARNRTTQEVGGTGLGLAITQSLVELHGGTITVTSEPGKGSTFSFTLPALVTTTATRQPPIASKNPPPLISRKPGRILVVDDEPDVARLIQRYLESDGYEVLVAQSGAEGLRLAKEARPDLITLDIMLGDTSGIVVLDQLNSDGDTALIPVMLVSIVEDTRLGKLLGAVDFLVKPVSRQDLVSRVGAILATRQ